MARLRIVELPMIHHGDDSETPFGVILDQVAEDSTILRGADQADRAFRGWGARGVVITQDTVDLADDQPAPDAELYSLGGHLLRELPRREVNSEAEQGTDTDRMDALTEALGIDRLRDWDEIVRAARIVRDAGHLFNEPGFLDPIRCARCGIYPTKVHLDGDRRTCAQVLADSDRQRLLGKIYDVNDREGFHADLRADYTVTKANAAKTPGLMDTHVGCGTCFDIEAVGR